MNAKHTPGPWKAEGRSIWQTARECQSTPQRIADVVLRLVGELGDEDKANAALIARAPDLLAENERLRAVNAELVAALEEMGDVKEVRCTSCSCEIAPEGYCGCQVEETVEYARRCRARAALKRAEAV